MRVRSRVAVRSSGGRPRSQNIASSPHEAAEVELLLLLSSPHEAAEVELLLPLSSSHEAAEVELLLPLSSPQEAAEDAMLLSSSLRLFAVVVGTLSSGDQAAVASLAEARSAQSRVSESAQPETEKQKLNVGQKAALYLGECMPLKKYSS
jgi:hypothetical protein